MSNEAMKVNKWRTADGKVMLIKDMTDNHLQNSINMLKRTLAERPADYDAGPDDSDGAYWAKISEERHNARIANILEKQIEVLEKEQKRRGAI